jgi:hypothetical protein
MPESVYKWLAEPTRDGVTHEQLLQNLYRELFTYCQKSRLTPSSEIGESERFSCMVDIVFKHTEKYSLG